MIRKTGQMNLTPGRIPCRSILAYLFSFLLFFACIPVQGMDISLFPAFSYERDKDRESWECNLAYPLLRITSEKGNTEAVIPFLFSMVEKDSPQALSLDFVWPLCTFRWKPRQDDEGFRRQFNFLFLFSHSLKNAPDGYYRKGFFFPFLYWGSDDNRHGYFIFFPFIWYAREAKLYFPFPSTNPQTYAAFLPFFGKFQNLGGNESIQTFLWPLFVRIKHKGKSKYHFLWPFLGYGRGEGYKAIRAWPLITWARQPDGSKRCNFLWPFGYHRSQGEEGDPDRFRLDMLLPFFIRLRSPKEKWDYYFLLYGRRDTPLRHQWSVLWPLFKTAWYYESGTRSLTLLLLFFKYHAGKEHQTYQIFPLFGIRRTPDKRRSFILWPFYHYKYNDYGTHSFTRYYLFPFYMRKVIEFEGKEKEIRTVLFPFYANVKRTDGSWKTTSARIFYYDKAEDIERNWSALLSFYRSWGDAEGNYEKRIFWKIYHRKHEEDFDLQELNTLLFQWKRTNQASEFNILGGLFGLKKSPRKTSLKLLFIPF